MRLVAEAVDKLGEGPCWSPSEGRLYWFDIKGRRLHWHEPASGLTEEFALPLRASAATPRASGGLLVSTERGLAIFEPNGREFELAQPHDLGPGFRSNDGKIDHEGRFWWSAMDDNGGERPGAVFVTHPDMRTERVLEGIHIPNAITVTPDGARLLVADSKLETIFAYDLPDLTNRRVFAQVAAPAAPDGAAMDADGYLWNAHWGGWRIVRYAPDGTVDRVVDTPVEQPSSCAFGGPGLQTLYVTSAWEGLDEAARAAQPLAGGLFAFEPGVRGMPLPPFQG